MVIIVIGLLFINIELNCDLLVIEVNFEFLWYIFIDLEIIM